MGLRRTAPVEARTCAYTPQYRWDRGRATAEMLELTKDLTIPSIQAPGSDTPVWKSGAVRKGRLKGVIISTTVFTVLAAAAVFLLALVTHPLWGNYPQTPATVAGRFEFHAGKGVSCRVSLQFMLDGTPHTASVTDADPCGYLPPPGAQVNLAYGPKDISGVLIAGRDGGIRAVAAMIVFDAAFVLVPSLAVMLAFVRSYRHARKAADKKPWREVTAVVKDINPDTMPTSLLLQIPDVHGTERDCVIRYRSQDLPEFAPKPGSPVTLWLVADGEGHAIITAPRCSGVSDATISTPNSFELRTLGL